MRIEQYKSGKTQHVSQRYGTDVKNTLQAVAL